MIVLLLTKSRKSKTFTNKSIKQSKKSARGRVGKKKGQNRKASPAGRGRLGGGGPARILQASRLPQRLQSHRS